jgi:beta-lactamase class A
MINLTGKKRVYIFIAILILIVSATFFYGQQQAMLQRRKAAWANLTKVLEERIRVSGLDAGLVIEDFRINSRIVYNADKPFASASLVKVPIMLAYFYAAKNNKINLNDTLVLKSSQKVRGSGIIKDIPEGTSFTIEELVDLMISHSDNTACNILIDLLGFDYINSFFQGLGLKDTNLSRKMMQFAVRRKGIENYTTAEDMAFCFEILYHKKFLTRQISGRCLSLLKKQEVNDRIPARIPESVVVAHKTGLERKICHDAGIMFTPQGDFLICLLTKNAKNTRTAKKFIAQIALDVYEYARGLR